MKSPLTASVFKSGRFAAIILQLTFLSGCNYPLTKDEIHSKGQSSARLPSELKSWQVKGKVAIELGDNTQISRFIWRRHSKNSDTVTFFSPLSLKTVTFERTEDSYFWLDGMTKKKIKSTPSGSGWHRLLLLAPGAELGNWLLGLSPENSNWILQVTEWHEPGLCRLPAKVNVDGFGLQMRIILSQWDL